MMGILIILGAFGPSLGLSENIYYFLFLLLLSLSLIITVAYALIQYENIDSIFKTIKKEFHFPKIKFHEVYVHII